MSEPVTVQEEPVVSPGQLLRQAREAAGLHVVALAAMLKVPVRKLEALEAGRFGDLPDKTFVRTLALSVCRQLKVDPTPILALLPQSDQVRLGEIASLNTPFKPSDAAPTPKGPSLPSVPRPVLFAVVVLLLAAAVWWIVPSGGPSVVRETVAPVSSEPQASETPPPVQAVATGNEPTVTTAPAEPGDAAPAEASAPAAAASGGALLDIQAQQVSWVEVIGASGSTLLQRELAAGETVGFGADAPFKVTVGRADATQVRVRGKALDISGYARNNVARFEVK